VRTTPKQGRAGTRRHDQRRNWTTPTSSEHRARFYPCHACHDAVADHDAERWPRSSFDAPAILCGACGTVLSVETYLDAEHACPDCGHAFNPGCAAHADRYFDV